jgi:hypothetical protein
MGRLFESRLPCVLKVRTLRAEIVRAREDTRPPGG